MQQGRKTEEFLGKNPLWGNGTMDDVFLDSPSAIILEGLISTYPVENVIEIINKINI